MSGQPTPGQWMRQQPGDLITALESAVRMFRAEEQRYRSQHDPKRQLLDKSVRRRLAAEYSDWARAIEQHIAAVARNQEPGE